MTRKMSKQNSVFQNEKYSNDVAEALMDNIKETLLLKQQKYFWGPTSTLFSWENNCLQNGGEKMHVKEFKNVSSYNQPTFDKNELRHGMGIPLPHEGDRSPPKSFSVKKDVNLEDVELKNGHTSNSELKNGRMGIPLPHEGDRSPPKSFSVKKDVNLLDVELKNGHTGNSELKNGHMEIPLPHEGDRRPPKSFSVKKDVNLEDVELKNGYTSNDYCKMTQKTIMNGMHNKEPVDRDRLVSRTEKGYEFSDWCKKRQEKFLHERNLKLSSQSLACNKMSRGKRIRPKSKSPVSENRKTPSSVNARRTHKFSKSMSQLDNHRNMLKAQVCIKIMDERKEKNQEFTVEISDLSRAKKSFPKLKEVLPEVDTGMKTAQFSMETVIFILRFALFKRYSKEEMPSATAGVEILAAVKTWEINELQHLFFKDFQKTLPSSNINLVFSQASHYGLNDVCDFCKEIAVDGISFPNNTYQRKQKMCFITISTYIEPLEFTIPFYPVEEILELSFDRHICNTIRFQALSSSFTLIGFHFQLNDNYLERSGNLNNLEIDYTTKNISEDKEVETGRCEKPLRQINVIYFSRPLIVNPKQTVEITVETYTKPYLCSALPKNKELQKKGRDGEFNVTIDSDFKLSKIDNLCMIGKLLYNMPELLNGVMK